MTGGKKRSYNSKEPNVVLCLPLPYDCSIVVTVEAHYTLLILMEKENASFRAQKHKADSSYHGMTALGTAQGCTDRFTSLTENINVSTAHSSVKLNSCHYNRVFSPPLPPHGLRVPSTYPSHSHILTARTTSRSSHLPLRLPQEKAKCYFFNISSACLWRSYTNILSSWCLSCTDRVQGQLWLFLPDSWCLTECSVTVKGARLAEALYELVSKVQRADRHIQALTNCFCSTYLQRCKISRLFTS